MPPQSIPVWLPVVGCILSSIDVALWLVTLGPIWTILKLLKPFPKIVNVGVGPDAPRRQARAEKELIGKPYPEVDTMGGVMKRSARVFADRPCIGTRQYLGEGTPDPKKGQRFAPKVFGETTWLTFKEAYAKMESFGRGLRHFGMESQPALKPGQTYNEFEGNYFLVLYENTCAEWMIAANGCWSQSIVVSTVYATLGPDAVKEAVCEGKASFLICNRVNVPLIGKIADQMPTLKVIIYTDDYVKPEDRTLRPQAIPNIKILSFDEVVEAGKSHPEIAAAPPRPDSLAVIMYTSGTTGKPKGVMIAHSHLLGMVTSCRFHFEHVIKQGEDVYATFLPLAHILELAAEHFMLCMGCGLGYCCPRTLTAAGAEPRGALEEYRPSIMVAVPKIWDLIKKGAEAKAMAGGPVKNFVLQWALQAKAAAMKRGMSTPLFDTIFGPIRKVVGGRVRIAISGGGPLDREVQEFVSAAITPMIQGYGLTETCGGATIQEVGDLRTGCVGIPNVSNEIKLVDGMAEDGSGPLCDAHGRPYKASDTVNVNGEPCCGRGEVLIGGTNLTAGYYKMPEQTKAVYKGGYFETGDIGEFTPDGTLKLVDRKKNLVKLKGGEYVALEFMEVKLSNSIFVDTVAGGAMVYAGGDVDRPSAFVQAARRPLEAWAAENGLADVAWDQLLGHPKARKAVLDDLNRCGKKAGMGELERLQNVTLLDGGAPPGAPGPDCWTPANGALSATNKLNRRNAMALLGKDRMERGKVDARTDWLK